MFILKDVHQKHLQRNANVLGEVENSKTLSQNKNTVAMLSNAKKSTIPSLSLQDIDVQQKVERQDVVHGKLLVKTTKVLRNVSTILQNVHGKQIVLDANIVQFQLEETQQQNNNFVVQKVIV